MSHNHLPQDFVQQDRGIARNFVMPGPSTHDMISVGSLLLSKSDTASTGTAEETLSRRIGLSKEQLCELSAQLA